METKKKDFIVLQSKIIWYLVAYHEQINVKVEEFRTAGLIAKSMRLEKKANAIAQIVLEFQKISNFDH